MTAHVKLSNSWSTVSDIYTKIGGSWKNVEKGYVRISGAWQEFFSSGVALTVDYLVVAGGGGAGGQVGGGGGAGGLLTGTGLSLAVATNYTVTIGAGGTGGQASSPTQGGDGANSVFSTFTAIGGGGGGANTGTSTSVGRNGGSGGGSAESPYSGGTGTTGQGNSGGLATNTPPYGAGGGGGAGAAGENGGTDGTGYAGDGGNGVQSSITGTATYYAGGGGGATYLGSSATIGIGGLGGGGNGGNHSSGGAGDPAATAGSPNTGGGAGGQGASSGTGPNGGSGVVIVKYPATFGLTVGAGLTYTTTTSGSNRITTFTSGTGSISFYQEASSSYVLLESVVLTGTQSSVEFTNLVSKYSAQYQHFQIRAAARGSSADVLVGVRVRLGTTSIDSGANYAAHQLYGYNGSVLASNTPNATWIFASAVAGANAGSSIFGGVVIDLLDPFESKNKTVRTLGGIPAGTGTNAYVSLESGAWFNTASVQQLAVLPASGSWVSGSRFSLYGLKSS